MKETRAQRFRNDPRLAEARKLIREALAEHQAPLAAPAPADPDLAIDYRNLIDRFNAMRGGELYFPYLGGGLGNGAWVELADGSVKLDFITGIGVHVLGHSHPALTDAAVSAALSDTLMQGNLQQNVESVALERALLDAAGDSRLAHCFLTTSGAMANENALKLCLWKKSPASRILAFEHCFAGRTLALSQVTDKPAYRPGLPKVLDVDYVPFFDPRDPAGSTARAVATLNEHLARHPGRHAGMILEMVQGEGGYFAGDRDFFLSLIAPLKQAGVAILIDEIQTFGRTPHAFAHQHFGLGGLADLVTIGKLAQVCATLFTPEFKPPKGLISQTFTGATAAIFAARLILQTLQTGGFFGPAGRIEQIHRRFTDRFAALEKKRPGLIAGPYGIGAMIALTPLDGRPAAADRLAHLLFDRGLIAFTAGSGPARLRFLPPIAVVTDAQIDLACDMLEQALVEIAREGLGP